MSRRLGRRRKRTLYQKLADKDRSIENLKHRLSIAMGEAEAGLEIVEMITRINPNFPALKDLGNIQVIRCDYAQIDLDRSIHPDVIPRCSPSIPPEPLTRRLARVDLHQLKTELSASDDVKKCVTFRAEVGDAFYGATKQSVEAFIAEGPEELARKIAHALYGYLNEARKR